MISNPNPNLVFSKPELILVDITVLIISEDTGFVAH